MEVEAANYYSRSVQVMRIVPQSDDRLGKVVLVAEDAEGCGAEHKITPARRFEAEPACGEHPQNMGARKHQDVALDGAYTIDNTVGSRAHLVRGLPSGAAVPEQIPIRALLQDLDRAPAFILAIVPFDQIRIGFGLLAETSQLASPDGALQRAGEDLCKAQPAQPRPERPGIGFAALGQRQIGSPGMLTRQAPGGLAVPRQIDDRKRFSHDLLPPCQPISRSGTHRISASGGATNDRLQRLATCRAPASRSPNRAPASRAREQAPFPV